MNTKTIDFIDFERINLLLEGFNKTTGFVSAIIDLDGNVLSQSGWRHICADFHRVHPETSVNCTESDTCLAGQLESGEKYNCYKCLNGLIDVAAPLVIKDKHVANLITGQFFFEQPDREFFKKQAKKYNFDEQKYLEALDKVPLVSEEKAKTAMDFLLNMTNLISEMTQQQMEQQQIEEDLRESNERFKLSFHSSPIAQAIINSNTEFVESNPAFSKLIAYSKDEIIGKTTAGLGLISPAERKKLVKKFEESSGSIKNAHVKFRISDGSLRDILYSVEAISFNGEMHRLYMGIDITEQKQAEQKVIESEERFRALYNNSPDMYISVSAEDASILQCNETLLKITGYSREEIIGFPLYKFYHEDCVDEVEKTFQQFLKTGLVKDKELVFKKKDDSDLDVSVNVNSVKDSKGKILYSISSLRDITAQKKAETELGNLSTFFKNVTENVQDGIWVSDRNDVIFYVNKGMEKIAGIPKDMIIGNNVLTDFPKETTEKFNIFYKKAKKELKPTWYEVSVKTPSGVYTWQNGWLVPVLKNKKFDGIICTIRDISNRKQTEELLKETTANLEALLDNRTDSIWSLDRDYNYIIFNKPYADIILSEHNIELKAGMNSLEVNPPEVLEFWKSKFEPVFKGENVAFEFTHQLNGSDHYFEVFLNPIFNDGIVTGASALSMDITDRKNADKKLKKSEEWLRLAQKAGKIGTWSVNVNTGEQYLSEVAASFHGLQEGAYSKNDMFGMVPDEDLPALNQAFQQTVEKAIEFNLEHRIINKNTSKVIWVHARGEAITNTEGKTIIVHGTAMDITERKKAEKELKDSLERETFWADIVKNASIGIAVGYPDGKLGSSNTAYQKITGYSGKELRSIDWNTVLTPPEYIESEMVFLEQLHKSKKPVVYEKEYIRKDGSRVPVELLVNLGFDKDENINYYFAFVTDITERKQAEEELKQSKKSLLLAQKAGGVGTWEIDLTTNIMKVSEQFAEIHGLSKLSLSIDEMFSLVPTEEQQNIKSAFDKVLKSGGEYNLEHPFRHQKSGDLKWVHVRGMTIRDENEEIIRILGTTQDITDRKLAKDEIVQYNKQLKQLLSTTLDGYILADTKGNILEVNPAYCQMAGYTPKELLAMNINNLEEQLSPDQIKHRIEVMIRDGRAKFNSKHKAKNGDIHDLDISIVVLNTNNKPILAAFMRDITDRKQAEMALIESENRFRSIFNNTFIGIVINRLVKDDFGNAIDFKHLEANNSVKRHLGAEPQQIVGTLASQLVSAEEVEYMTALNEKVVKTGTPYQIERYFSEFNRTLELSAFHLEDDVFVSTFIDITDRKLAEDEIVQSQERYQSLFNNSPVPLWEEDFSAVKKYIVALQKRNIKDFRKYFKNNQDKVRECVQLIKIIDINNSVLKLHEAESKEELFKGLPAIFTDKSYEAFTEELIAIAEGRSECEFESNVKTLKGNEKDIYLKWMTVPGYEETLENIYISTIDITHRKRAELALIESEEKFKSLMEQSPFVVEIYDLDGLQIAVNKAYEGLWGFPAEATVNKFNILKSKENIETGMIEYTKRAYNGEPVDLPEYQFDSTGETEAQGKGRKRWLSTRLYPLKDKLGNVKNMVAIHQDISERKQAEEELKEIHENLEQLIKERTKELEDKNKLLERINKAFVGRELRMKELKQEIEKLKNE